MDFVFHELDDDILRRELEETIETQRILKINRGDDTRKNTRKYLNKKKQTKELTKHSKSKIKDTSKEAEEKRKIRNSQRRLKKRTDDRLRKEAERREQIEKNKETRRREELEYKKSHNVEDINIGLSEYTSYGYRYHKRQQIPEEDLIMLFDEDCRLMLRNRRKMFGSDGEYYTKQLFSLDDKMLKSMFDPDGTFPIDDWMIYEDYMMKMIVEEVLREREGLNPKFFINIVVDCIRVDVDDDPREYEYANVDLESKGMYIDNTRIELKYQQLTISINPLLITDKEKPKSIIQQFVDGFSELEGRDYVVVKRISEIKITMTNTQPNKEEQFLQYINEIQAFNTNNDTTLKKYMTLPCFLGEGVGRIDEKGMCILESHLTTKLRLDGVLKYEKITRKSKMEQVNHIMGIVKTMKDKEPTKYNYIQKGQLKKYIDLVNSETPDELGVYIETHDKFYPHKDTKVMMFYRDRHCIPTTTEHLMKVKQQDEQRKLLEREYNHIKGDISNKVYTLRKLVQKTGTDRNNSYGWDVESFRLTKNGKQIPDVICVYGLKGQITKKFFDENVVYDDDGKLISGRSAVLQFIRWIENNYEYNQKAKSEENKKIPKYCFWSFGGISYDNLLIFKHLVLFGKTVRHIGEPNKVKNLEYKNIRFLDFRALFGGSLENISRAWLGKGKMDNDIIKNRSEYNRHKNLDEIGTYCLNDAQLVYELTMKYFDKMSKFQHKGRKLNDYCQMTIASLSMKIFRSCFLEKDIKASPHHIVDIERRAFFGGISIAIQEQCDIGWYADINSSYPYSMTKMMPYKYLKSEYHSETPMKLSQKVSNTDLFEIKFKFKRQLPHKFPYPFPIKDIETKRNTYPSYSDNIIPVWGTSINTAFKLDPDVDISVYCVHHYKPKAVFKEFSETLYAKRKEYKDQLSTLKKTPEYIQYINTPKDLQNTDEYKNIKMKFTDMECALTVDIDFMKSLLNNFFGKTGQRAFNQKAIGTTYQLKKIDEECVVFNKKPLNEYEVEKHGEKIIWEYEYSNSVNSNHIGDLVRFASYITARSRTELFKGFLSVGVENVVYCDTDACISKIPFPNTMLHNSELGKWKLENEEKPIHNGIFLGSKTYSYLKSKISVEELENVVNLENIQDLKQQKLEAHKKLNKLYDIPDVKEIVGFDDVGRTIEDSDKMFDDKISRINEYIVCKSKGHKSENITYFDYQYVSDERKHLILRLKPYFERTFNAVYVNDIYKIFKRT